MEISILLHQYYSINKRYFCLVVVLECLAAAVMWYLQYTIPGSIHLQAQAPRQAFYQGEASMM